MNLKKGYHMFKLNLLSAGLILSTLNLTAQTTSVLPTQSTTTTTISSTTTTTIETHPTEIRAAIDIGSGSTKLKVAEVDKKTNKIIKVLFKKEIAIAFEKQLSHSPDTKFNQQIIDQAIHTFATLKDDALKFHAIKVVGIATASFRKAKNAEVLIEAVKQRTGVEIDVIDQDQEGHIAFQGAIATCKDACNTNAVTWDIGGGSVQYTIENKAGQLVVYKETLASVAFQNYIMTAIQKKPLSHETSPNPMSAEDVKQALPYAAGFAQQVTPEILTKIRTNGTIIMGVGGVFAGQIARMFNKKEDEELLVTTDMLQQKLSYYSGLDNKGLEQAILKDVSASNAKELTAHLNTFYTNIVLILGTLEGLQIKEFFVVDVNNADGALGSSEYWIIRKPFQPPEPDLGDID